MKTILITGATAGFGEASARKFVGGGWNAIGTGRRGDRLKRLQQELGVVCYAAPGKRGKLRISV